MVGRSLLTAALVLFAQMYVPAASASSSSRFEISIPRSVAQKPVTGRLILMVSNRSTPDVRLQASILLPMFGTDIALLRPGEIAVIDGTATGNVFPSLDAVPSGDYYVQALLNVYSQFHREDGHVIWAHMDQWEGQAFNVSPGNLYSKTQLLHLDSSTSYRFQLSLTETIPAVPATRDTEWVKRVKIQSALLSKFWGRPMYIGAVVLLPRGYQSHSEAYFPVVYKQDHFSQNAPFDFQPTPSRKGRTSDNDGQQSARESGYEFYKSWSSDNFPRMIAVSFLHPTPYYDDSYAVNSANNGPYGDALVTELIPYLEEHFRIIREPYARVLTGGSTGGWAALALQVFHPDVFGGTWSFFPDPVDFRRYGTINIYEDVNAFRFRLTRAASTAGMTDFYAVDRYFLRTPEGQPTISVQRMSQYEATLGSNGRSGAQLAAWEAAYGPVGDDGYPTPLWDKTTGTINRDVANYMRDHGYDLRSYMETHWPEIGGKLAGKLHFYCGDMDDFYLNLGLYLLEDFLKTRVGTPSGGSFEYGRPVKGHGWQPMTNAELLQTIAEEVRKHAPEGLRMTWNYK